VFKTLRRSFAGAAALAAVSIVPVMASQMPLGDRDMPSHGTLPNATIRLPKHPLPGTSDSGALGIGGAATPNVRCPRGAYCLTP
jgi:hypothetical protein